MPKQSKTNQHMDEVKPNNPPFKPRKHKEHPLAKYSTQRDIPFPDHPSPLNQVQWRSVEDQKQVEKMERKLRNCLHDLNSPCTGEAVERRPVGECSEDAFDTYMSAIMDPTLYKRKEHNSPYTNKWADKEFVKHIVYEFNYPNIPSLGDISWAKNYVVIDQSDVVKALKEKGATIVNEYAMSNKLFRCITKKLVISFDTQTEIYYVRMNHWVQSLSEDVLTWIESF